MRDTEFKGLPIGAAEIQGAITELQKYKEGKANLDNKIIENEDWWKLQHDRYYGKKHTPGTRSRSAWLFNSLINKHADAMDNYPEPTVLPREQSDEQTASILSSILPVTLENCDFEETYSSCWWDKLKSGGAVYAVLWDKRMLNGLGDISIKQIELLNFYWEPGIQDLQDSRNIFYITLEDNSTLEATYPQLKGKLNGNGIDVRQYNYDDTVDITDKSAVIDWYYKVNYGNGDVLHYVQFVNDTILYSSENEEYAHRMEEGYQSKGYYWHGKYPFVMDVLYEEKGTPMGFGYIDVMKNPQTDIDSLGSAILDNAKWSAKPRWFIKDSASINVNDYQDSDKQFVPVAGSVDDNNLKQITVQPLSGNYVAIWQAKVDELKETSGNRDFSQGSTASGVTSGAAITALQEAGSKGSRDIIKGSYRAFTNIIKLVIELYRQFYDNPRTFRIIGANGAQQFVEFDNTALHSEIQQEYGIEFKSREPVFDVKIKAQRANPYSRLAQNELALQFYQLGFFNPQMADQALACIEMMDFEGKDKVKSNIERNGGMFNQLQQMQQALNHTANALAMKTGDTRVMEAINGNGNIQQG